MKRKQTPQAKVCELERKLLMPWGSFYPCTAGKFFVTHEFASKWVGTTETSGPPNFFFVFALVSAPHIFTYYLLVISTDTNTVLLFSFSHLHPHNDPSPPTKWALVVTGSLSVWHSLFLPPPPFCQRSQHYHRS